MSWTFPTANSSVAPPSSGRCGKTCSAVITDACPFVITSVVTVYTVAWRDSGARSLLCFGRLRNSVVRPDMSRSIHSMSRRISGLKARML